MTLLSCIKLFADDTKLYRTVSSEKALKSDLQVMINGQINSGAIDPSFQVDAQ